MTINKLLGYAIESPAKTLRGWMLDRRINAEYRHLDYFERQQKHAQLGAADSRKRIVNLEAQRRDL